MNCPECNAKLTSHETLWDCPECGYSKIKVKYAKLEEQNAKFLKKFLGDDDILKGCSGCGNPAYPNCKLSCSLFDD